jgi:hypothetical protein
MNRVASAYSKKPSQTATFATEDYLNYKVLAKGYSKFLVFLLLALSGICPCPQSLLFHFNKYFFETTHR